MASYDPKDPNDPKGEKGASGYKPSLLYFSHPPGLLCWQPNHPLLACARSSPPSFAREKQPPLWCRSSLPACFAGRPSFARHLPASLAGGRVLLPRLGCEARVPDGGAGRELFQGWGCQLLAKLRLGEGIFLTTLS